MARKEELLEEEADAQAQADYEKKKRAASREGDEHNFKIPTFKEYVASNPEGKENETSNGGAETSASAQDEDEATTSAQAGTSSGARQYESYSKGIDDLNR